MCTSALLSLLISLPVRIIRCVGVTTVFITDEISCTALSRLVELVSNCKVEVPRVEDRSSKKKMVAALNEVCKK